jgi:Cof subfamily protein (haloacid dehalogenase superfamily)
MPRPLPNYKEFDLDSLRPFSEIRLVALDLDGTLLDSNKPELPKKVLELARSLKSVKYGVRITIATGRTLTGARSLLDTLPILNDTPVILYNGSLVLKRKYDVLYRKTIPAVTFQRIIELSSRFKVKVIAYFCEWLGENGPKEHAFGWSSLDRPRLEHNKMPVKWLDWDKIESTITPSAIVIHTAGQTKAISRLGSELNKIDDISYTLSGTAYIEVRPKNSNKGIALKYAGERLKLNRKHVLAIGDNDNDAEMLSWAGIGVVVDSASDLATKSSDYIAHGGIIDGAIEVLNLVRIARGLLWSTTNHTGRTRVISPSITKDEAIASDISEAASSRLQSIFISEGNVLDFCYEVFGRIVDVSKLQFIISLSLLPVYRFGKQNLILKSDLASFLDLFITPEGKDTIRPRYEKLFEQDTIRINSYTSIDLLHEDFATVPTFFSATRNLISEHKALVNPVNKAELSMPYFPGARLTTLSKKVFEFAKVQLDREKKADINATSQLAGSANYLGSKRALCGFLVEGISSVLTESGVVVDLMCGSGVASGAFSRIWKTYSSDAQQFCRILAVIHGGGFDRTKAQDLISRILPIFKQHFNDLQRHLADAIEREDKLFRRNTDESLLQDYKLFLRNFPTLSNENSTTHWNVQKEVNRRREDHSFYPYCLFTTYFSNVYFGLRQSLEIDSLRFSIDQLQDENEKNWALGALIATVSSLGTTYGGHFAQPPVRNYNDITLRNLSSIIDKRLPSITHEFAVRLLNLSEHSQNSHRSIEIVPGPWRKALSILDDKLGGEPVLVYVDPPYTREEYSRYYHVLETLVLYNYPSRTGIGLTPKPGDRFKSEFFTRVETQVVDALASIIINILQRGWFCAWSYSGSGAANIYQVISSVYHKTTCDIKSYSAPFVHQSHGRGRQRKKVTEYLIIFSPKK